MNRWLLSLLLLLSLNSHASSATQIISILDSIYGTELSEVMDLDDLNEIESQVKDLTEDQLNKLVDQLNAMTGHYGYGDAYSSEQDKSNQKWSPSSWESALKGESGNTQERYQSLLDEYQLAHPALSSEQMTLGAGVANTADYEQSVGVNQAANVQATYEFNDVNAHLETLQGLSRKIEEADNEKSIADLNARINTEIAYLSIENIKMLTVLNQQYAQSISSDLAGRKEESIMNQLPTE
jgi:type IV secretion system protein VirB5